MSDESTNAEPKNRNRILIGSAFLAATAIIVGGAAWMMNQDKTPPPRRIPEPIVVQIMPPPPPPPPPPPQAMPEEKMIEQPKMVEPEIKDEPIDKPEDKADNNDKDDAPPPGPLALDAAAEGPGDAMGLGSNPGGRGLFGGAGRSRWGWYASMVQAEIESALRNNAKLRNSLMQAQIRIWADSTGRISRVQIVSSTGNAEFDSALQNEVLPGLRLREGPPGDMPMPMVTRITVRRPS